MNRSVRAKSRDYSFRKQLGMKHHEAFFSARQRRAIRRLAESCDCVTTIGGSDLVVGIKNGETKILELV